ncbi:SRPBCC domain-containing protein [Mesorhizobium sp.]|uniref:SRPBCC domain-containing protein n=1 Tax=Mesorhizobium sp. TaxID=1871066 RepID=UPI0025E9F958|nr:SRPBCC domain-containing protein [Mesorhizobium sp.]
MLAWEPPNRIVLAWRIRADWQYDPSLLTEVEVKFSEAGENATRVELEHRQLENMGAAGEAVREIFESDRGWCGIHPAKLCPVDREAVGCQPIGQLTYPLST